MTLPAGAGTPVAAPAPSQVELERRLYRRQRGRRSVVVSVVSTLVVLAVVYFGVVNTPGWAAVQQSFFDPQTAVDTFPDILLGLWLNVRILFFSAIGVAVFGTLLAVVRGLRNPVFFPLRMLATGYTDLFRGLPLIIVLYLVGYGIPGLGVFPRLPAEVWGTIAITLTYSSYIAEVLRAGMEAVHPSQRLAARSLGLSHAKTLRLVVLPQAIRKVTPALMNDFVSMQKDVGLVSILGAVDAVRSAQIAQAETYNFTPYFVAGLLFVVISLPLIRVTDAIARRQQRREQIGGTV
ncbi:MULTISPECIES: amino acid ABC transporter permease [Curtobacterium]|jgi:polar amino acid transport system permease protein|uniref:amino acid ABC transporter permease n=1 Tax=Curtobacterium TaxID=2034 RepID=UPI0008F94A5F|nr:MULTISPECIES: amino acid ABC transporter permease [Curtobacterium]MBF4595408.1 amino acid ABC transporter permease [Curtobacterium flaccumfaciens]MBF4628799.1 amino acid ABC transporter permease [Curtobacterium flaccumfaciens]MBO9043181.1 amino acid ABC transporter permease [Curtobacterium flaccumfaciens pv. flaccumfaciens]MBO9051328.1 amino acid ABC transporter permease [Curtobacterium flaccumfaciens pv. flaccumfaciens]MBO9055733.1 amino acid ABC transporter permease [Curtobacterium flaccu